MCKSECNSRIAKSESSYLDALEGGLAKNLRPPKLTDKGKRHVGIAIAWVCAAVVLEYACISVGSKAGSMLTQM